MVNETPENKDQGFSRAGIILAGHPKVHAINYFLAQKTTSGVSQSSAK